MSSRRFFSAVAVAVCTALSGCQNKANPSNTKATQGFAPEALELVPTPDDPARRVERASPRESTPQQPGRNLLLAGSVATRLPLLDRHDANPTVTPKDVLEWSRHGVSEETIVDRIEQTRSVAPLTAAEENHLLENGVPESVVQAMKSACQQ